ncbi:MAG TPA: hypothetical protein DCY88_31175 [Cyanobacteria bacterium UBA11372]|nr:hypothetical protein [Cyanobacteria bacterium UBA11372]
MFKKLGFSATAATLISFGITQAVQAVSVANTSPGSTVVGGVEVLAPDALVAGKTQGKWGDLWWQYILSIPKDDNPASDITGEKASIGQSGPVFFLAGLIPNGPVERTITVPADKYIFFPLINQAVDNTSIANDPNDPNFFGNLPVDSDDSMPPVFPDDCFFINPNNPPSLRSCTASIIDGTSDLFATINGLDLEAEGINLFEYRQQSPEAYSYTVPIDNVVGFADPLFLNNPGQSNKLQFPATIGPTVSDGFWLMLAPLPPGKHTLNFGGTGLFTAQNVTYNITSVSVPEPASTLSLLAFGFLGASSLLKRLPEQQKSTSSATSDV